MAEFNNEAYEALVNDLINDAFYLDSIGICILKVHLKGDMFIV